MSPQTVAFPEILPKSATTNDSLLVERLYRIAGTLQTIFPLSMRGLLVLLVLAYLSMNPILRQSDIVASSLVSALLTLILISAITCSTICFRLRRQLNFKLFPALEDGGQLLSQTEISLPLKVGPINIPPFFTLTIRAEFINRGALSSRHILTGKIDPSNPIIQKITFPHRGIWKLNGIHCELQDRFGFSNIAWIDTSQADCLISIHPKPIEDAKLPILSSTYRAGDDLNHQTHRMGELFDLKPYHPSDGIKKILWKVFAKRGELIARHPELAVTPEGHVIAYILATRTADRLAAWSLAYVNALQELNLSVEVGCLGMQGMSTASSANELDTLLVASAFLAPRTLPNDLQHVILNSISSKQTEQLVTLALFLSEEQITSEDTIRMLVANCRSLEASGLKPVICLQRALSDNVNDIRPSLIKRTFLQYSKPNINLSATTQARNALLRVCAASNIQVFQEPLAKNSSLQEANA
jgi:uncharacterized protein (DUF58 family)